jgi:ribosomal protein L28
MVHFFNYGEPFMHKQAEDMLLYLRDLCPGALILTSTNGIPLAKMERAVKVVAAKLDHIWFTICGATQESYEKYQKKGRLKLALQGLQNIIDARHDNGKPHVTWRYVVFKWNDSFAEIDHVINLSREIGVDELKLHLTHVPHDARSFRLAPGTPGYYRYRRYIDEACNYTAPAPPDDGIYPLESLPGFGPAHWTTYKARLILAETNGSIHLSVSTNRLRSLLEEHHVFIQTPWQTYKTRLIKDCWADITLPVPDGFRAKGPFAVELLTDDYWFPAEDLGTADTRCLGMLLHKDVMATCEHGPADLTPLSRQEFPYDQAHNYPFPEAPHDGIYPFEDVADLGPAHWTTYRARLSLAETNGSIHLSVSTNRLRSLSEEHYVFLQTLWKAYKTRLIRNRWADITIPVPDRFRGNRSFTVELFTPDFWIPAEELGTADGRCLGMLLRGDVMTTIQHTPAELVLSLPGEIPMYKQ